MNSIIFQKQKNLAWTGFWMDFQIFGSIDLRLVKE